VEVGWFLSKKKGTGIVVSHEGAKKRKTEARKRNFMFSLRAFVRLYLRLCVKPIFTYPRQQISLQEPGSARCLESFRYVILRAS
jgi:hypothetical protein